MVSPADTPTSDEGLKVSAQGSGYLCKQAAGFRYLGDICGLRSQASFTASLVWQMALSYFKISQKKGSRICSGSLPKRFFTE